MIYIYIEPFSLFGLACTRARGVSIRAGLFIAVAFAITSPLCMYEIDLRRVGVKVPDGIPCPRCCNST